MRKLGVFALGAMIWVICVALAYADEPAATGEDQTAAPAVAAPSGELVPPAAPAAPAGQAAQNAYGFTPDDIAVNQGAVAYWYAHGYANAFGCLPQKWSELKTHNLPLRKFESPHTGEEIDFDDGSLDFDGDMTYAVNGCDALIQVKTTTGVVTLPGSLPSTWNCAQRNCNPCNPCGNCCGRCPRCCDITICGWDCWGYMCPDDAVCKIIQWMMWRSFETYECRYGQRPCDDMMWMASGFAPVDKNWKELAPQMYIEYIYKKCSLVKAKVHCCSPCMSKCGSPCGQPACGGCGKPGCDKCHSKCSSCGGKGCSKCHSQCDNCGGSGCDKCHGGCGGRNYHSQCSPARD
jgi:hypothetical protein